MVLKEKKDRFKGRFSNVDKVVLIATLILVCIGVLMIFSITGILIYNNRMNDSLAYVTRTIVHGIGGILGMILVLLIPYKTLKNVISPLAIIGTLGLLALTLFIGGGTTSSNVNRWISIAGFRFQPAEFARIGLVLSVAWIIQFLVKYKMYYTKKMIGEYLFALLYIVICGVLVVRQPDLGSAVVVLGIGIVMFLSSGINKKQIGMILVIGIIGVVILGAGLQGYQEQRFDVWRDPFSHDRGDQNVMGFTSIALGEMFGVGLGRSTQKYGYAIEPHTDFIIALVAEELGTIAVLFIMIVYFVIAVRCFFTAFKGRDVYSPLICIGVGTFFLIQPLVNLGGVIGLIPLSGVTLPFISYGGTSLIATFLMLGIYFNARSEIMTRITEPKRERKLTSKKIIPFRQGA